MSQLCTLKPRPLLAALLCSSLLGRSGANSAQLAAQPWPSAAIDRALALTGASAQPDPQESDSTR